MPASDLGAPAEALADDEEALALYRELAAANPAHQPDLANTLPSHGGPPDGSGTPGRGPGRRPRRRWPVPGAGRRQPRPPAQPRQHAAKPRGQPRGLGRHQEALADDEEALALWRELAAANPAHQPDLATTLQSHGVSLRGLGRHQEALAGHEEALALYRELAAANPAHQPNLANYAAKPRGQPADLGRHQEALADEEEALALYRALAASNPGRYEKTYQRLLAGLRRAYDLQGDHAISAGLHLRDDVTGEQQQ